MYAIKLFFLLGSKARKTPRSAEQRLISKLLENYDPRARPVIRATDVVNVSFELTLQQIVDLVSNYVYRNLVNKLAKIIKNLQCSSAGSPSTSNDGNFYENFKVDLVV